MLGFSPYLIVKASHIFIVAQFVKPCSIGKSHCCHREGCIEPFQMVTEQKFSFSLQFPRDEDGEPLFDELICKSCVPQCLFLSKYPDLIISPSAVPDASTDPVEIVDKMDGSGI